MAVVVPVVAAFATASAGVAAIATATTLGVMSGYAMVAGAVLSGVGAVTGKKDLMKIGGILSLAGGIGSLANGANLAAEKAASEAAAQEVSKEASKAAANGAVGDAATQAAQDAAIEASKRAGEQLGTDVAAQAATAAPTMNVDTALTGQIGQEAAKETITPLAEQAARQVSESAVQQAAQSAGVTAADIAKSSGGGFNIMEAGSQLVDGLRNLGSQAGELIAGNGAAGGLSGWVKNNKELLSVVGSGVNAVVGPGAELNKLRREQMRQQQSIYDTAMANANAVAPIYSPRLQALRGLPQGV